MMWKSSKNTYKNINMAYDATSININLQSRLITFITINYMQTSLSVSQYVPTSTHRNHSAVTLNRPNFRNDIVMPTIYDIDNIKIILEHNYPPPAKNNVIQAKKLRVQKNVQQIVSKKHSQIPGVKPLLNHKLARPQTAPKKIQTQNQDHLRLKKLQHQDFILNFDERINEMGITLQETSETAKQRFNEVFSKTNNSGVNKQMNEIKQDIDFYLTSISPKKKGKRIIVKSENKKVEGYLKQLQRRSKKSSMPRPKSSIEKRSTPKKQQNHFVYRRMNRYSGENPNINKKSKNHQTKDQCKKLLQVIEDRCRDNDYDHRKQIATLKNMRCLWNERMNKEIEEDKSVEVYNLVPETLHVLQKMRQRVDDYNQLDKEFLH